MTTGVDPVLGVLVRLVPVAIRRSIRRRQAAREIEKIRRSVDECGALYQALTLSGTVQLRLLPADSTALAHRLHTDGFISDQALTLLDDYFNPAQQANALLTAPPHYGPPMLNQAWRVAHLRRGREYVETRDGDGLTLHDRVKGELAAALSAIRRPLL